MSTDSITSQSIEPDTATEATPSTMEAEQAEPLNIVIDEMFASAFDDEPHVDVVDDDVYDALERAVVATGREFDPMVWSFGMTSIFGHVANDASNPGSPVLVISADCRTMWVDPGEDTGVQIEADSADDDRPYENLDQYISPVERAFGTLSAKTPLERSMIEFVLLDHGRFYRGPWHIVPIDTDGVPAGWVCTRRGRFGRLSKPRQFLVHPDQRCVRFTGKDLDDAARALI